MKRIFFPLLALICLSGCAEDPKAPKSAETGTPADSTAVATADTLPPETATPDSLQTHDPDKEEKPMVAEEKSDQKMMPAPPAPVATAPGPSGRNAAITTAGFVDILSLDSSIRLDIRYATTNNFTQAQIYDCARCLLRPEAARAIAVAQRRLKREGYSLKLFDCYRPQPYQQRLWDKVPNPDYVTPPVKGSMHSRGAAVDITLVDAQGKELDMGTSYDFFGPEAHSDYTRLSGKVLANRRLLRRALESVGFKGIRTEWWHFSYQDKSFPLSDFVWDCPER